MRGVRVPVQCQPTFRASGGGFAELAILVPDEMNVVNPERIASSQNGRHVVSVVDGLDRTANPPKTLGEYSIHSRSTLRCRHATL